LTSHRFEVAWLTIGACLTIGLSRILSGTVAAADFQSVESEKATEYADALSQMASKLKQVPVKIEPNASKAHGVHRPEEAALLIVPDKRLEEGVNETSPEVEKETGAPLGYLFTYRLVPVVANKPATGDQLRTVPVPTDEGREIPIVCLTLAVQLAVICLRGR
jgi:hypothetical protein